MNSLNYPVYFDKEMLENGINIKNDSVIFCCEDKYYLPRLAEKGSSGYDITIDKKYFNTTLSIRNKFRTGVKICLPNFLTIEIKPRSSTFDKTGMILTNHVGEIDSSYRGEIIASTWCVDPDILLDKYRYGDLSKIKFPEEYLENRINLFQMKFHQKITHLEPTKFPFKIDLVGIVDQYTFRNFDEIFPTERGAGGFGSTDKK